MITKWKLSNFKTVRDDTALTFAPLTIFAGANSSGKSSWIQSILMVCQTLLHRISSRSVVLNGSLARLGQFDDLRSFDSDKRAIDIGWECEPRLTTDGPTTIRDYLDGSPFPRRLIRRHYLGFAADHLKSVSCEISFDTRYSEAVTETPQLNPNLARSNLTVTFLNDDGAPVVATIDLSRSSDLAKKRAELEPFLDPPSVDLDPVRQSLQFDVSLDPTSLDDVRSVFASAQLTGCICHHFLPVRLSVRIDSIEEKARILANYLSTESVRFLRAGYFTDQDIVISRTTLELLQRHLKELFPSAILDPGAIDPLTHPQGKDVTLRDWIEAIRKTRPQDRYRIREAIRAIPAFSEQVIETATEGGTVSPAIKAISVPEELLDARSYLDSFFSSSISYLGPLRDEPKALYPLPTSPDLTYVGLRGEYTAAVLDLHKYKIVDYVPPAHFKEPTIRRTADSGPLHSAVGEWLKYLGVADSVETTDRGKLGHELRVHTPGVAKAHDLTHAGVGVSQVLPILVSCLISDFDTTLLFEQPELHLHPAVQSRLADFFLSMALLGKQCVIETHSEYLINRLRFRMAAAPIDAPLSSLTKIYFVEKKSDASTFKDVVVNDFGAITDWPDGFFDQSQDEAERILRAASLKRERTGKSS
jgi:predicted ATPase